MKDLPILPLLFGLGLLAVVYAAGVVTGPVAIKPDCPSLPEHVHRGGFEVEAPAGHYLIYSQTGEIHKMEAGEWKLMGICPD